MKNNKKLSGIEAILNKLKKSVGTDEFEEEEYTEDVDKSMDAEDEFVEDDVNYESDDVYEGEYEEDEEEFEKSVDEDSDIEEDEEELAKSVDEEDAEDEEDEPAEEEPIGEETVDIDYDDLVAKVTEDVTASLDERLSRIEEDIKGLIAGLEKSVDILVDEKKGAETIEKSINGINRKLDKLSKSRKSVDNIKVHERFEKSKDFSAIPASKKASILADALEAGNRNVRVEDITNAELGRPISKSAQDVLNKSI